MNNPFNPTFSDVPKIFLDADSRVDDLIQTIKKSEFARSFFITGVRGSGKTVFLNAVAHKLRKDPKCYQINVLNRKDLLTSLTQKLINETETPIQKVLNSVNSVSLKGINFDLSDPNIQFDVVLEKILRKVKKQKKYVVITIDEITNTDPVKELAQIFNELKGEDLPIFILMTGLPDLVLNIQNDSKLTFLLRSEKIYTLPLKIGDVIRSYAQVFNCSLEIASQLANMTKGYSYAFQLLGYLLFEHLNGKVPEEKDIESVKLDYQLSLFDNAYQKIFTDLSDMDRRYLIAVAGNNKMENVINELKKDKVFVAQYRRRAIERHLVSPAGYGIVRYTLPYFDEYFKQVQDPDSPYFFGY